MTDEEFYEKENRRGLQTHESINERYSGSLEELKDGSSVVRLDTNDRMIVDRKGLIHGGFIFSAADFAAMAAVNEKNVVLSASSCQFLAPAKLNDTIIFEATVRNKEGRKRNIKVTGKVGEIKIFSGEFQAVVTDSHVLKLDLLKTSGVE
jgi:acyl-CoA thioesterase